MLRVAIVHIQPPGEVPSKRTVETWSRPQGDAYWSMLGAEKTSEDACSC